METNFTIIYNRVGNYPGNGELSSNVARHHIIGYPFMQVYAIVAAWYSVVIDKTMKTKYEKFFSCREVNSNALWTLYEKVGDKNTVYLEMDPQQPHAGIINRVCWAESNLFIGPAGCYRSDDPSQRLDRFPISMNKDQKRLAINVKEAWNEVSKAAIRGDAGKDIKFTLENVNSKELKNFVDMFLDYINYTETIHITRYDDWEAISLKNSKKYTFWVNPRVKVKDIRENEFKFQMRDKAASESEEVVCIAGFNSKKQCAFGVPKNRIGMGEQEKILFQGNVW